MIAIQFDSGVAGGEGHHKGVGAGGQFSHVLLEGVVQVHHVITRG